MTWVRCRSCRTVSPGGETRPCPGCGAPLENPLPYAGKPPLLHAQVRRDLSFQKKFLCILPIMGVIGFIAAIGSYGTFSDAWIGIAVALSSLQVIVGVVTWISLLGGSESVWLSAKIILVLILLPVCGLAGLLLIAGVSCAVGAK